jgi:hypothetical protein
MLKILTLFVFFVVVAAVLSLLMAWPFMWLWNYAVVSALTVAKPIGYWVAFWLLMFVSLFIAGSASRASKS